jgi:hypothetical protein
MGWGLVDFSNGWNYMLTKTEHYRFPKDIFAGWFVLVIFEIKNV